MLLLLLYSMPLATIQIGPAGYNNNCISKRREAGPGTFIDRFGQNLASGCAALELLRFLPPPRIPHG
jgi:hypothetical protein